jgi:serine/threonine-protein kinase
VKRCTLLLGVCAASLLTRGVAFAEDRAAAQLLFDQGKALMADGKVADACQKFAASAQLSLTPGVRLNLVDCWTAMGRTASAWVVAEEALDMAERAGDQAAAAAARQRRDALKKQLTYLSVTVSPDAAVPGLEVSRDGQKMPAAEWGTPVPVDPGPHEIVARAPGRTSWSTTPAATQPGTTIAIAVPVLQDETKSAPSMSGWRELGLASAGLGVVGLAVGGGFAVDAAWKKSTYQAHEGSGGQCADPTCQSTSQDAYKSGTWSTVAFVAGGALCAAGALLWFYAPGVSAAVTPVAGPQTAGLAVVGGW